MRASFLVQKINRAQSIKRALGFFYATIDPRRGGPGRFSASAARRAIDGDTRPAEELDAPATISSRRRLIKRFHGSLILCAVIQLYDPMVCVCVCVCVCVVFHLSWPEESCTIEKEKRRWGNELSSRVVKPPRRKSSFNCHIISRSRTRGARARVSAH